MKVRTVRRIAFLAAAASVAACALTMFTMIGTAPVNAATASLERIIRSSREPLDRTYEIRVVQERTGRVSPEEQLDGAILHVRGMDRYVFVRRLADGRERISGSDGTTSWSFREDGPVHVSFDATRFRGKVPGSRQGFSFVNIHEHLERIREGYDVELFVDRQDATADSRLSRLACFRKSPDVRGPKRVDLWFDWMTGVVHSMLIDGLPRGKGGPKSVSLDLVARAALGPNFFSHEAHHEPDRRVKYEESRRP